MLSNHFSFNDPLNPRLLTCAIDSNVTLTSENEDWNGEKNWLEVILRIYQLNPQIETLNFTKALTEREQNELFQFLQTNKIPLSIVIHNQDPNQKIKFDNQTRGIQREKLNEQIASVDFNDFGSYAHKEIPQEKKFSLENITNQNGLKNVEKIRIREKQKEQQHELSQQKQKEQEEEQQKQKQMMQMRQQNLEKELIQKVKPVQPKAIEVDNKDYLERNKLRDMTEYYSKLYPEDKENALKSLETLWDNVVGRYRLTHENIPLGRVLTHINRDVFKLLIDNKDKLSDGLNLNHLPQQLNCFLATIGEHSGFVLGYTPHAPRLDKNQNAFEPTDLSTVDLRPKSQNKMICDFNQFLTAPLIASEEENKIYLDAKKNPSKETIQKLCQCFEKRNLMPEGFSKNIAQIFDNMQFNENNIKAFFYIIDKQGPTAAIQVLKGLTALHRQGDTAFTKFKTNFIDGQDDLSKLVNNNGIVAIKEIIELNERAGFGDKEAQAQLNWWHSLSKDHMSHDKTEDVGRMWQAYQNFLSILKNKNLTLPEGFNALPIKNMFVALNRITQLVNNCQRDPQGQLDQLYKIDLGVDGAMYAMQQENSRFAMYDMQYVDPSKQKNNLATVTGKKFSENMLMQVYDDRSILRVYTILTGRNGKKIMPKVEGFYANEGQHKLEYKQVKKQPKAKFVIESKNLLQSKQKCDITFTFEDEKHAIVTYNGKTYKTEYALYEPDAKNEYYYVALNLISEDEKYSLQQIIRLEIGKSIFSDHEIKLESGETRTISRQLTKGSVENKKRISTESFLSEFNKKFPGQVFIPTEQFKSLLFDSIKANNIEVIKMLASRYISQQDYHDLLEQYEAVFVALETSNLSPDVIQKLAVLTALMTTSKENYTNQNYIPTYDCMQKITNILDLYPKKIPAFNTLFSAIENNKLGKMKINDIGNILKLAKGPEDIHQILELNVFKQENTSRVALDLFDLLADQINLPNRQLPTPFSTYLKILKNEINVTDPKQVNLFKLFCLLSEKNYSQFAEKISKIMDEKMIATLIETLSNIDYSSAKNDQRITLDTIEKIAKNITFDKHHVILIALQKECDWIKPKIPPQILNAHFDTISGSINDELTLVNNGIMPGIDDIKTYFVINENTKAYKQFQKTKERMNLLDYLYKDPVEKKTRKLLIGLSVVKLNQQMVKELKLNPELDVTQKATALNMKNDFISKNKNELPDFFKNINNSFKELQDCLLTTEVKKIQNVIQTADYMKDFMTLMIQKTPIIDVEKVFNENKFFRAAINKIKGRQNEVDSFINKLLTHNELTKKIVALSDNGTQSFHMKSLIESVNLALTQKMDMATLVQIVTTIGKANIPMGEFFKSYLNKAYKKGFMPLKPTSWQNGLSAIFSFNPPNLEVAHTLHDILLKSSNRSVNKLCETIKQLSERRNQIAALPDSMLKQFLLQKFDSEITAIDTDKKNPSLDGAMRLLTHFDRVLPLAQNKETANHLAPLLSRIPFDQIADFMNVANKLNPTLQEKLLSLAAQSCLHQWQMDSASDNQNKNQLKDFTDAITFLSRYYNDEHSKIKTKMDELLSFGTMIPARQLSALINNSQNIEHDILQALQQHDLDPHARRRNQSTTPPNDDIAQFDGYLNQVEDLLARENLSTHQKEELKSHFKYVHEAGHHTKFEDPLNKNNHITLKEFSQKSLQAFYLNLSDDLQQELAKNEPDLTKIQKLELNIMAVSREILFRSTGSYPYPVQLLPMLITGMTGKSTIFQIATGEGKSLITAMTAMLYHARGYHVNVVSWNGYQAKADQLKYQKAFDFIKAPTSLIHEESKAKDYKQQGINYGSMENIVQLGNIAKTEGGELRRDRDGKKAPIVTIADEVDFYAMQHTSPINLSQPNPLFINENGESNCEWIYPQIIKSYQSILSSITEKDYPLADDLFQQRALMLRTKLIELNPDKKNFLNKISHTQWQTWLQAAVDSEQYTNIGGGKKAPDYRVVVHTNKAGKETHRTINVVSHGVTQDINTQFKLGVHQMLTAREQLKDPNPPPFYTPPEMLSIAGTNVKNQLLSFLSKGILIGLTGTPDDVDSLCGQLGMAAMKIPTREDIKRNVEEITFSDTKEKQHAKIESWIKESHNQSKNGEQPILLVCDNDNSLREWELLFTGTLRDGETNQNPQSSSSLAKFLKAKGYTIQFIDANDDEKSIEEKIKKAGDPKMITLATGLAGRGVDFSTQYKGGFLGIPVDPFSHTNWEQVVGRVGRQGKDGTIKPIFNKQELEKEVAHIKNIEIIKYYLRAEKENGEIKLMDFLENNNNDMALFIAQEIPNNIITDYMSEANKLILEDYKNQFNTIDKIPAQFKSKYQGQNLIADYKKEIIKYPDGFENVYYYRKQINQQLSYQKGQMDLLSKFRYEAQKPYIRLIKSIFRDNSAYLTYEQKLKLVDKIIEKITEFHQGYDLALHRANIKELKDPQLQQEKLNELNKKCTKEFEHWYGEFKQSHPVLRKRQQEMNYLHKKDLTHKKTNQEIIDEIANLKVKSKDGNDKNIDLLLSRIQAYLSNHMLQDNSQFLKFAVDMMENELNVDIQLEKITLSSTVVTPEINPEMALFYLACHLNDPKVPGLKAIYDELKELKYNKELFSIVAYQKCSQYEAISKNIEPYLVSKEKDILLMKASFTKDHTNKLFNILKSVNESLPKETINNQNNLVLKTLLTHMMNLTKSSNVTEKQLFSLANLTLKLLGNSNLLTEEQNNNLLQIKNEQEKIYPYFSENDGDKFEAEATHALMNLLNQKVKRLEIDLSRLQKNQTGNLKEVKVKIMDLQQEIKQVQSAISLCKAILDPKNEVKNDKKIALPETKVTETSVETPKKDTINVSDFNQKQNGGQHKIDDIKTEYANLHQVLATQNGKQFWLRQTKTSMLPSGIKAMNIIMNNNNLPQEERVQKIREIASSELKSPKCNQNPMVKAFYDMLAEGKPIENNFINKAMLTQFLTNQFNNKTNGFDFDAFLEKSNGSLSKKFNVSEQDIQKIVTNIKNQNAPHSKDEIKSENKSQVNLRAH